MRDFEAVGCLLGAGGGVCGFLDELVVSVDSERMTTERRKI